MGVRACDRTHSGAPVARLRVAFGGVAATPIRATAIEAAAQDRPWTRGTIDALLPHAAEAGTPLTDLRGSVLEEVRAPYDGWVVILLRRPHVKPGDRAVAVAMADSSP